MPKLPSRVCVRVEVPPASLPKLAFELLREKFSGQLSAVDAFGTGAERMAFNMNLIPGLEGPAA